MASGKQILAGSLSTAIGAGAMAAFFATKGSKIGQSASFEEFMGGLQTHEKAIFWGGIAFLALALIVIGGSYLYNRRQEHKNEYTQLKQDSPLDIISVIKLSNQQSVQTKNVNLMDMNNEINGLKANQTPVAFDINYRNGTYVAFEAFKDQNNNNSLTINQLTRNTHQ